MSAAQTAKQRWRSDLRKALDRLTAVIPHVLQLERDLALSLATTRRLIGENTNLRT